jgi:hypothetical protein
MGKESSTSPKYRTGGNTDTAAVLLPRRKGHFFLRPILPQVQCVSSHSFARQWLTNQVGRHVEAGLIPGHTPEQLEAIQVLEDVAQRLSLHMVLAVGDIQFVADSTYHLQLPSLRSLLMQ